MRITRLSFLPAVALFFAARADFAQTVKCPDTRDVWLSSANAEEANSNGGKSPRIKLKFFQEFGLLDFDVSALKGKNIDSATLYVAPAGGAVFGGARGTDLRWFTLSSISSQWVEGLGEQYASDTAGHGATFNEASFKTRPWTVSGSKCWDVTLGNGNTLRSDVDAGDPKNGWFAIPVDKRLIEAMVCGASYGLLLMDGSTGVERNCTIFSREQNAKAPYLMVNVSGEVKTAPGVPLGISLAPSPNDASLSEGAVTLSLTVPERAFAYNIKIGGQEVPRWQIPFAAKAGSRQQFIIEHLAPDSVVALEIVALDEAGNSSPIASASGKSSPKITVPKLPDNPWRFRQPGTRGPAPPLAPVAYPQTCKIDPLTGHANELNDSLWDPLTDTVSVASARGDIASFQVALQGPASGIKASVTGLPGIKCKIWRAWFVKSGAQWVPEYALPLNEGSAFAIPSADNKIPGQKAAVLAVDLIVPADMQPGEQTGSLLIESNLGKTSVRLRVKIYPAVIPAEIHFNPELNAYSGPGEAGSEEFFDSFRLAHYHRCTINRVNHSHQGNTAEDMTPDVDAQGHVTDWTRWDKNLGPLLDGSAFKDNPRAGVPVPVLYLPQNESWPLKFREHYHPGVETTGKNWKPIHDLKAKPPEEAFDQQYKDAFAASVADFVKHAEEKKWTRTLLEGFHNNKAQYGVGKMTGTAWTMDEPSLWLDWQALLFFSRLFHQGIREQKTAHFVFRGDISRPMWQGNCFDGLMEILYAGGDQWSMLPLMKASKRRMPATLMCYGACNSIDRPNHESTAWCIKAYLHECDGVVPWQSLDGDAAFERGDPPGSGNALIVDGRKRFGLNAVASFRVHALREGAQIAELLRLLEIKKGWGRAHSAALVSQIIPMNAQFHQAFADDAAALQFEGLNGDKIVELKEGLLQLLDEH